MPTHYVAHMAFSLQTTFGLLSFSCLSMHAAFGITAQTRLARTSPPIAT